jgi:hypothetical protein
MESPWQRTEVREAHRFDEEALDPYLAEHLANHREPLRVWQFTGMGN